MKCLDDQNVKIYNLIFGTSHSLHNLQFQLFSLYDLKLKRNMINL